MSDGLPIDTRTPFEPGPELPRPVREAGAGSVQSVIRNSAIMGATAVVSKVLTTLFTLIVIRRLSPDDFGLYGFANGFVFMFGVFFDMGLRPLLTRELVRRDKDPSLLYGSFLVMKAGMGAVNLLLIFAIALAAGYGEREWEAILFFALASAAGSFFNFNTGVFNAYERMEHDTAVKLTWRVLTFLGGWGALSLGWGLKGLLWVWLGGGLLATTMSFLLVRRHLPRWTLRPDLAVCLQGLRDGWPIWVNSLFTGIYMNIAIVALKHFGGDEAVARYNMPFELIYSTVFIATALVGGLTPPMFREAGRDPERLARILQSAMKWVLILAIPFVLGGLLFAEPLVLLVNPKYLEAVPAFRVQSLLVLFLFLNSPFQTVLIAVNEQRKILLVMIAMAATGLAATLAMVPAWGALGASWAVVLTHLVGFGGLYLYTTRFVRLRGLGLILLRPAAAGAVLLGAWLALIEAGGETLVPGGRWAYVLAVSVSGTLVYAMALFLTGSIEARERGWMLGFLGRRPPAAP